MTVDLLGYAFNLAGGAVEDATAQALTKNTTTQIATTTTDSNGKFEFSGIAEGLYDIKVTSGSSVRWRKYDDEIQTAVMEAGSLRLRGTNGSYAHVFQGTPTATRTITFPDEDGTVVLTSTATDITLDDDVDVSWGTGADALMRWSDGDADNHALALGLGDTSQQFHITDKAAIATDWARSAGTHPEVAIHSNTTPASDYLAIGNHDGTTASIDVVGGTTLDLRIAGTDELQITAAGINTNGGTVTGTTITGSTALVGGTIAGTSGTFSGIVDITLVTDATDATGDTGALRTEGGASIAKKLYVGSDLNVTGNATITGTTTLNGALVLGDAAADTLTVNATIQGATPLVFEGADSSGSNTYETSFAIADPTADRTITFPDASLTVNAAANISGTTLASNVVTTSITTVGTISSGTWQGTAIASGYIAADAITGAKIADDAIGSEHIADDAVVTAAIADDAITSALIADDAVVTAAIADDAITSALLADDAVVTAAIADNAITNALMADDAIDSAEIADGAVDLAHMSSESVDEDNLHISNSGSNGQFLSKQSGNAGGLTWATPASTATALDDVATGDAAATLATTVGNITIDAQANNADIIFKGTDDTSDITMLTLDGSEAGKALFNGDVSVGTSLLTATIDYTDGDLAMTIADGGGVTFAQDATLTSHKYLNLPENSSIKFTDQIGVDNSIDNDDGQGIIFTFRAGATVTPFSPVYVDGNNEVQECDADAIATMPCIGVTMNTSDVSADADIEVMMLGLIRHDSFSDFGAAGAPVYASGTAGALTTTAPSGEDDVVQIVGHSIAEDLIFVQPCLTTIEHTG